MPYISNEALAGAVLLVVLALGYQYLPKNGDESLGKSGGGGKKKNKNKRKSKDTLVDTSMKDTPKIQSAKPGIGKQHDGKERGVSSKDALRAGSVKAGSRDMSSSSNEGEGEEDESTAMSYAAAAAPGTAPHQSQVGKAKPKTLAEKIAPKPRKTKVDDMLAPEDRPVPHARVMKIAPPAGSSSNIPQATPPSATAQKLPKFEDDYASGSSSEDDTVSAQAEDDGWDVVHTKKRKPVSIGISGSGGNSGSTSQPLPVETKIQRKNAKKAEAKKAAKAAEEAERLKRLAMHKKVLERERINEIYSNSKKTGSDSGGSKLGGGAKASVDVNGKLIWE